MCIEFQNLSCQVRTYLCHLVMAVLSSRCGHHIFGCGFFYLLFSSPNFSRRRLDVYHTSTHGMALVRI